MEKNKLTKNELILGIAQIVLLLIAFFMRNGKIFTVSAVGDSISFGLAEEEIFGDFFAALLGKVLFVLFAVNIISALLPLLFQKRIGFCVPVLSIIASILILLVFAFELFGLSDASSNYDNAFSVTVQGILFVAFIITSIVLAALRGKKN